MKHIYYLTYKIENADSSNYSEILSQAEKWFEYGSIDELLDTLAEGDLLYVDTISSLGKSIKNQVEQYHNIRFIRKVHVILLDNPDLSDATKLPDEYIESAISFTKYVYSSDRSKKVIKQKEGLIKSNNSLGRKEKHIPENFLSLYYAYSTGKISLRKAGQSVGVSGKTFKKWCDQYENKR